MAEQPTEQTIQQLIKERDTLSDELHSRLRPFWITIGVLTLLLFAATLFGAQQYVSNQTLQSELRQHSSSSTASE